MIVHTAEHILKEVSKMSFQCLVLQIPICSVCFDSKLDHHTL